MLILELNGRPPGPAESHRLVTANYGHFTSMQVRDGKVRGLALHLARLDDGNADLFGARQGVEDEHRLRELIRHALGPARDASVRVTFMPGEDELGPPDVLVAVTDPAPDVAGPPLRVRTDGYEREWPGHKHVATMGKTLARRRARQAGYDEALLVGRDRRIRETTTANIAFWDGGQVVWPKAPVLKGVTMVLLQVAMTMNGVPWTLRPVDLGELPDLLAAAAVNSLCAGRPIASVDDVTFTEPSALTDALHTAWATVPADEI